VQFHFAWQTLSAIAGVTCRHFYFRLYPGTIKSPQVVDFLKRLQRHLPGKLLIVWDGLRQHRSRLVKQFIDEQHGRLHLEYLPAYAPELNPVEYLWGNTTNSPTSVPTISPRSVPMVGARCGACSAVPPWWRPPWKQAELFSEMSPYYVKLNSPLHRKNRVIHTTDAETHRGAWPILP
jgi:hypothetical protein